MGISPQRREKRQRSGRFSQKKTTEETKTDAEKQTQRSTKARQQSKKQKQQAEGRDRNLPSFFVPNLQLLRKFGDLYEPLYKSKYFLKKHLTKTIG